MPWLETNVLEQRIRFVSAALVPGVNRRALCRAFGISPPTGYKWLARYAALGALRGLQDQSRRPQHQPRLTTPAAEAAVVALRQQYGWAGRKLQPLVAAAGYAVAPATIDRIIRRRGLTDRDEAHRPAVQRFTRAAPNDLWQIDFKGQYPLRDGWGFPFSVLDDHSRFAIGLAPLTGTAGAPVTRLLTLWFQRFGVPTAILLDHGVPWWNATAGHGLTRVTVFLLEQDIDVIYSGIRHPQTQGKVERFHRTLGRRLRQWGVPTSRAALGHALARFRREYNEIRPHEALNQRVPASCYTPSTRRFTLRPTPWIYPSDHRVVRVNVAGAIRYDRRVFFVCDALATRWVGCHHIGDRVLVRFRQHYVRELDLRTGRTSSMLRPATGLGMS